MKLVISDSQREFENRIKAVLKNKKLASPIIRINEIIKNFPKCKLPEKLILEIDKMRSNCSKCKGDGLIKYMSGGVMLRAGCPEC